MKFYNREEELKTLGKIKKNFRIAVVGRRRVGKTTLVEHFYRGGRCITFFIPAEKAEKEIIASWVKEYPELHLPAVSTFKDFFDFVFFHLKDKVIFIDELQNLLKVNKSFLFDLQRAIDKYNPNLVVSGSLVSMMKKILEKYKSPLYGRFDFIIKLKELDFKTIYEMCRDFKLGIRNAFELYAVFGGIPKYYELIEKLAEFEFESFVLDSFVRYPRPLYEEVRTMLKEEFGKEYKTFFSILSAISQGKNRHSEISAYIGKKQTEITKYLAMLRDDFEFIERKLPVIGGKKGIYTIKNNIISFWFANVWKHSELLETGQERKVEEIVKKNLNKHISQTFEKTIYELMLALKLIPFEFTKIGRQWGKIPSIPTDRNQYEIDIVALNEKKKEILFAECKWQDKVDAEKVLQELKQKAAFVDWKKGSRQEHFTIFAKSFKEKIKEKNVYCFDLKDIEMMLKKEKA